MSPTLTALLSLMSDEIEPRAEERLLKKMAQRVLSDKTLAFDLLEAVGAKEHVGRMGNQLISLLTSALDEARMSQENGRASGSAFIRMMENRLATLNMNNAIDGFGRFNLASCWKRAGLDAPEALAVYHSDRFKPLRTGTQRLFEGDGLPDVDADLDKLLDELSVNTGNDQSMMRESLSEILVTLPRNMRRAFVRLVVGHSKNGYEDLGCAWVFDRQTEVRHGAIDGLSDRMAKGLVSPALPARLALMRSWLGDKDIRDRIDVLIRDAKRLGVGGAQKKTALSVHRVLASIVDGSGAQSFSIALQSGTARKMAIALVKQGFGIKDAYVVSCSSASEQRRVTEMLTAEVGAWDVPLDYVKQAIAIGLHDGLEAGNPPAMGLIDVVAALGLPEVRPNPCSVHDLIELMDPEGEIANLPAQAKLRLINASKDWDVRFPTIMDSWYEDSDVIIDAVAEAETPATLKRALLDVLDGRREYWAHLIARSALLLHNASKQEAKQFAAVALALADGWPLKKIPVMETIAMFSLEVWQYERGSNFVSEAEIEISPFQFDAEPPVSAIPKQDISLEKPGELTQLLQAIGLTDVWVAGYMTGVCISPNFIPLPSWLSVLFSIFGSQIPENQKLQRIFELLMQKYNAALATVRAEVGDFILPQDEMQMKAWSDGLLAAWDGNLDYWPSAKLDQNDKVAKTLLEKAATGQVDKNNFNEIISQWLRERSGDQVRLG